MSEKTKPFTNVVIREEIKNNKQSGYYVTVDYMYGDADGYNAVEYGPFKKGQEKYLAAFANMLEECVEAYPNGRGGDDNYENEVPAFAVWAMLNDYKKYNYTIDGDKLTKEDIGIIENVGFEVETTPDGWGTQATICSYKAIYYDADTKKKFNVSIS